MQDDIVESAAKADEDEPIENLRGRLRGNVEKFLFGGKAVFTLVSGKTGAKIRFKMRRNQSDVYNNFQIYAFKSRGEGFKWLGTIKLLGPKEIPGEFYTSHKCKFDQSGPEFSAFEYMYEHRRNLPDFLEFWHEGRCSYCTKPLTDPTSIARGIGPKCWKTHGHDL